MSAAEVCYYGLVVLSALVLVVNLVVLACQFFKDRAERRAWIAQEEGKGGTDG